MAGCLSHVGTRLPPGMRTQLGWGLYCVAISACQWCTYLLIGGTYICLLDADLEPLASLFLPCAISLSEGFFVRATVAMCTKHLQRSRGRNHSRGVSGDQRRLVVPFIVGTAQSAAEVARLISLLAGAMRGTSVQSYVASACIAWLIST